MLADHRPGLSWLLADHYRWLRVIQIQDGLLSTPMTHLFWKAAIPVNQRVRRYSGQTTSHFQFDICGSILFRIFLFLLL